MGAKDRARAVQTQGPGRIKSCGGMLIRQKPVYVTAVRIGQWKTAGDEATCAIEVDLSDGRKFVEQARFTYSQKLREQFVEKVAKGDRDSGRAMRRYLDKRARAMEKCLGELQRCFGDLVVATPLVETDEPVEVAA